MADRLHKMISEREFLALQQSKGLSIHGIPLIISPKLIHLAKRERDIKDGLIIYELWKKEATLFTRERFSEPCYYCHPDKRGELESKVRRN